MKRWRHVLLLLALAETSATAGGGAASLGFGVPGESGSVDIRCDDGRATVLLWLQKPPRDAHDGTFTTSVRFFHGRRMVTMTARGHVADATGGTTTRLDMALADPAAFLDGVRRNGRLVAVSYAGRTIQPLPPQGAIERFLDSCRS